MAVEFVDNPLVYPPRTPIACQFKLTKGLQTGPRDWICVIQSGWSKIEKYVCFEWVTVAAHAKDSMVIVFQGRSLPKHTEREEYEFVYVDTEGQILGSSEPFKFTDETDSVSSFEYVSNSGESLHQDKDRGHEVEEKEREVGFGKNPTPPDSFMSLQNSLDMSETEVRETEKPGTTDETRAVFVGETPTTAEANDVLQIQSAGNDEEGQGNALQRSQEREGDAYSGEFSVNNDTVETTPMDRESVSVQANGGKACSTGNPKMEVSPLADIQLPQDPGCCLTNADQSEGSNKENGDEQSPNQEVKESPVDEQPFYPDSLTTESDDESIDFREDHSTMLKKTIELSEVNSLLAQRNAKLEHLVSKYINITGPLSKSNAALQSMWKNENQAYRQVEGKLHEKISALAEATARVELLESKLKSVMKSKKAMGVELARCQEEKHELKLQLQVVQRNLMRFEKEKVDLCAELKETNAEKAEVRKQLKTKEDEHNTIIRRVGKLEVRCEALNEQIHVKDKQAEILLGTASDQSPTSSIASLSALTDMRIQCPPSLKGPEERLLCEIEVPLDRRPKSGRRSSSSQVKKSASLTGRQDKQHSSNKERRRDKRQKIDVTRVEVQRPIQQTDNDPSRCFACGVKFPAAATTEERRVHFEAHFENQDMASDDIE